MKLFTISEWVLAHKALIVNDFMSGAPAYEIKNEPRSGGGCEADVFMNEWAELLLHTGLFEGDGENRGI